MKPRQRAVGHGPAPMAAGYAETPYWWSDGALPPAPAVHALPAEADVVIVGGGYTGISAARDLARRGKIPVVVEKGSLGRGASTRNGGSMHPGVKRDLSALIRTHGTLGRALYQETLAAFDFVESTISEAHIDCDYVRSGQVELAYKPAHVPKLQALERLYQELGEPAHFIARDELRTEIGSDAYFGGLVRERSGTLHPAKYFAGLVAAAHRNGAELHEQTPVTALERDTTTIQIVRTPRGTIRARDVLIATDGYVDSLLPELQRRVIPIGSYMIATEPIDEALAASVSPRGRAFIDSKNFLFYWRVLPDRRIVFGGRTNFRRTTVQESRDVLYRALMEIHPQLEGTHVANAWGGNVGFTFDRLPHVGRRHGVTYATGYCGSGIALSTYLGSRAAAWLTGEDPPSYARLSFPPVPMYRGNPWFLPFVGAYYNLRDRLP